MNAEEKLDHDLYHDAAQVQRSLLAYVAHLDAKRLSRERYEQIIENPPEPDDFPDLDAIGNEQEYCDPDQIVPFTGRRPSDGPPF